MQSTLVSMSKRVTSETERVNFANFLNKMGEGKIDSSINLQIVKNFAFNMDWVDDRTQSISKFFMENQLRLPEASKPNNYKVLLEVPNIRTGDLNFNGDVEIEVKVNEATNYIQMHSRNHIIDAFSVKEKSSGTIIEILELSLYPGADMLTIYFTSELQENSELIVNLKFKGQLLTGDRGFYMTNYTMNGETRYLATTQFEPYWARQAFPCYDEPEFKAVFEVKIIHEKSLTAIANMDGVSVDT